MVEEPGGAELPVSSSVYTVAAHYMLDYGTEAQKRHWLSKMASDELLAGIAMIEPDAGCDLQGIRTRAVRDGDVYVINGAKTFITNGAAPHLLVVVVRTSAERRGKGRPSRS